MEKKYEYNYGFNQGCKAYSSDMVEEWNFRKKVRKMQQAFKQQNKKREEQEQRRKEQEEQKMNNLPNAIKMDLGGPNKQNMNAKYSPSRIKMFGEIGVRVRVRTKLNKEGQNRQENEKSSSTMEAGVRIEPNKEQRPSQQPKSIAEMCSEAGIPCRTTKELNKEQRPSQVEQKTQSENKAQTWNNNVESYYRSNYSVSPEEAEATAQRKVYTQYKKAHDELEKHKKKLSQLHH